MAIFDVRLGAQRPEPKHVSGLALFALEDYMIDEG